MNLFGNLFGSSSSGGGNNGSSNPCALFYSIDTDVVINFPATIIPFTETDFNSGEFSLSSNNIVVSSTGIYYISYSVAVDPPSGNPFTNVAFECIFEFGNPLSNYFEHTPARGWSPVRVGNQVNQVNKSFLFELDDLSLNHLRLSAVMSTTMPSDLLSDESVSFSIMKVRDLPE